MTKIKSLLFTVFWFLKGYVLHLLSMFRKAPPEPQESAPLESTLYKYEDRPLEYDFSGITAAAKKVKKTNKAAVKKKKKKNVP